MKDEKQIAEIAKVLIDYTKKNHISASTAILSDYAEEIYNAGYRKQAWISVDERLPERNGRYLIIDDEGYMVVASWYKDSGWFIPICRANPVTHWMPLPEAPKMKGGAE